MARSELGRARVEALNPRRWPLFALVVLGVGAALSVAIIVYRAAVGAQGQLAAHHTEAGLSTAPPGFEALTFRTTDGLALRGWVHTGSNGATIVFAHGQAQTRLDRMVEAQPLVERGFGALVFDLRAHGQSEGQLSTLGDKERLDLAAALDAAVAHTHATRLGMLGFSIGGVAVEDVAWKDARVAATVLVAPDPDIGAGLDSDFRHWGPLSRGPARWVARRAGIDLAAGHWAQALPSLASRGLLVVFGSREEEPPVMRALAAQAVAAGAEILEVPGARHGGYATAAPELYPAGVTEFFVRRLGPPP